MGACSDSGQNCGYDIAPTLARCQERARRSIPLPSKQVNGSDSSYKAAGAPWEAALQPPTPPFEAHKRVIQQSDMAQNSMFCGAKIATRLTQHHGVKGSNKNNHSHSTKVQKSGSSAIGAVEATCTVALRHTIAAQTTCKLSCQVSKRRNRPSGKS